MPWALLRHGVCHDLPANVSSITTAAEQMKFYEAPQAV
jgi:hypothetical protein